MPKVVPKRKPGVAPALKNRHKLLMRPALPALIGSAIGLATLFAGSPASASEPEASRRYEDDRLPPAGTQLNVGLAGAAIAVGFYLPVLGASYIWDDAPGASDQRIPVVGPWIAIGRTQLCSDKPFDDDCNDFVIVAGAVLLGLDALGQTGGVAMMLQSIFLNTAPNTAVRGAGGTTLYSNSFSRRPTDSPFLWNAGPVELSPAPFVGGGSDLGLALTGRF